MAPRSILKGYHPFIGTTSAHRPRKKGASPCGNQILARVAIPSLAAFLHLDKDQNHVFYRIRQGNMNLVALKMES
jgi:hypothetical protein